MRLSSLSPEFSVSPLEWLSENPVGICNRQEERNSNGRERPRELARQKRYVFIDSNHWPLVSASPRGRVLYAGGLLPKRKKSRSQEGVWGCACVCMCLRDTCIYSTRAGQSRPAGKVLREMDGPIFYFATPSGHAPSGYPHIICIYTHIFAASCESHGCRSVNARTRNFPSRAHGALRDVARFPCAPGQKRVENHAGR